MDASSQSGGAVCRNGTTKGIPSPATDAGRIIARTSIPAIDFMEPTHGVRSTGAGAGKARMGAEG